jgi:hypothetical protein
MKYVVTEREDGKEELFMFPKHINHDDFAEVLSHIKVHTSFRDWERQYRKPIAAGFTDGKYCTGRSETLNLDSRGRLDEMLIG